MLPSASTTYAFFLSFKVNNPEKLSESIPHTDYTSYSVNKGEQIVFCLRSKDKEEKLIEN